MPQRTSYIGKRINYFANNTSINTSKKVVKVVTEIPKEIPKEIIPKYIEHTLTVDSVIHTLESVKDSIYYVNYVNNLIDKYFDIIKQKMDFKSVISDDVVRDFFELDNVVGDYFWIHDIPNNTDDVSIQNTIQYYTYKEFDDLFSQKKNKDINCDTNLKTLLVEETKNTINILNRLKQQNSQDNYTYLTNKEWKYGIKLDYLIFRRLPWDNSKWIVIGSGINLNKYLPNTNNKYIFSKEYQLLINTMAEKINIDSLSEEVFDYGSVFNFNNLKCIISKKYPYWNNTYLSQCYIKNSNEDIPCKFKNIITSLNNSVPNVSLNNLKTIISYNIENNYFCGIITFSVINERTYFSISEILINSFIKPTLKIPGDMALNGNLTIKNIENDNLIIIDNYKKITTFNNKIGINQEPYEVNALLDIDNLANINLFEILNYNIKPITINSYHIITKFKDLFDSENSEITSDLINLYMNNDNLINYRNQCAVLQIPIIDEIQNSNIEFLYTSPTGEFNSLTLDVSSYNRIKYIMNNISKLKAITDVNNHIFTFIILLNDINDNFLCSLKGFEINNKMFFIMTYKKVNNFINDKSYNDVFIKYIDTYTKLSIMMEVGYSIVKRDEIYSELIKGNSVNSFTKFIQESSFFNRLNITDQYFFCFELDGEERYLFSEDKPEWNNKKTKDLYIPNTTVSVSYLTSIIKNKSQLNYNLQENQTFIIDYDWVVGYKNSFLKIIIINNKKYLLGSGINAINLINQSIITKGDITCSGNMRVTNTNNDEIFKIDVVNKNIINNYNVGIGTSNPTSTLHIVNSTIDDIINTLNDSSKHMLYNQLLIEELIKCDSDSQFESTINKFYEDISNDIQQTQNSFITVNKINLNTMLSTDMTCLYNPIYPIFNGNLYSTILYLDPNIISVIKNYLDLYQEILNGDLLFDKSLINKNFEYIFGFRRLGIKCFSYKSNLYILESGLYIQKYDLNMYTDKNLVIYMEYSQYSKILLNCCFLKFHPETVSYNKEKQEDNLSFIIQKYPFIIKNIVIIELIETNKFLNSKIDFFNFNNEDEYVDNSKLLTEIEDEAVRRKYYNIMVNLYKFFGNSYKSLGYTGVIYYDDNTNDYKGSFIVVKINEIYKIVLIEANISDIIKSTVQISGDMNIQGDLFLTNKFTKENYINLNPTDKYVGIGTNERYTTYSDNYVTTSDVYNSKHHVYIKNDKFPNAVFERIGETSDPDKKYDLLYANLASVSGCNVRRKSNYFDFNEMFNYANYHDTILKNSNEYDNVTHVKYGVDLSYELTNKNNITKELGCLSMVIDKIDSNHIYAGFSVNAFDNGDNNEIISKNLMYVDNDSTLHVKQIKLNGKTLLYDKNNDCLIFDGKIVNLI